MNLSNIYIKIVYMITSSNTCHKSINGGIINVNMNTIDWEYTSFFY